MPSPLGAKTFPWSVGGLTGINHHQAPCFNQAGGASAAGGSCPYGAPATTAYMAAYGRGTTGDASLASLRIKASKPVTPPAPPLSACQYAPPLWPYSVEQLIHNKTSDQQQQQQPKLEQNNHQDHYWYLESDQAFSPEPDSQQWLEQQRSRVDSRTNS